MKEYPLTFSEFISRFKTEEQCRDYLYNLQHRLSCDNKYKKLPLFDKSGNPIAYKEFDVNNYIQGFERDAERFVRGSDGTVYYTKDHYSTFLKIE